MPRRSEAEKTAPDRGSGEIDGSHGVERDNPVARFEQEMQELEAIVAQMEHGELRLEDSLKLFERGTLLARSCRTSLETAELKVRKLMDTPPEDPAA